MENKLEVFGKRLNESVVKVITAEKLEGFEKAYLIATAAGELKSMLTAEYMKPIMDLQNNRLGFKTDKSEGGYPESVVKNCLIEAVLTGVQPFGNQFNIIAGNCYITKEGFGHLLGNVKGLDYSIVPSLPRINADASSAAIVMNVEWTINGQTNNKQLDIPVKMNKFMGTDAVIGKATRKARAWLYNRISDIEIADGDVTDIDHKVVDSKAIPKTSAEHESERVTLLINEAKTLDDLKNIERDVPKELLAPQLDLFIVKKDELELKAKGGK